FHGINYTGKAKKGNRFQWRGIRFVRIFKLVNDAESEEKDTRRHQFTGPEECFSLNPSLKPEESRILPTVLPTPPVFLIYF
ncbi:MAG: hypothetical protein ABIK28_20070, partial [Planctomycetota bacterium]